MELSLRPEQKQTFSQKLIQSSEILQMAASQLEEYLNEQALENPVLELTEKQPEEFGSRTLEKYQWIFSHDEQNRYLYQQMAASADDPPEWNFDAQESESLRDHLWSQLLTRDVPKAQEPALRFLLSSLDARGYFTDSLEEFSRQFGLAENEGEALLSMVQSLEPAGVGARDLEECLCLQLERQGLLTPDLEAFVRDHLTEMAKNQLPAIAHALHLPVERIKEFCQLVRELNPKPGAAFSDVRQVSYIVPDVIIVKFKGHFDILLNESLYPDIALNAGYVRMCKEQTDPEVTDYLCKKIRQAEWLKKCIAQRNTTLFSVSQTILKMQEDFFLYGPSFRKALRLSDVAAELNIHESTVSRAIQQKYLQCSWGIFPLSHFFARAAAPAQDGSALTASDVKDALKRVIAQEDKKKPHSDRALSELLAQEGFPISRRTVAKYREEEGIPSASGRKEY